MNIESLLRLNMGLGALPILVDGETRSISPENPTGEKGGGARAEPTPSNPASLLGKGWKVRPCITLEAGKTTAIAEIEGCGVIQHIWMTVSEVAYRSCVLRMYWDGETQPSVEVPLGDFFCCGHGLRYEVNSLPIAVNPVGGFNSYFPKPFRRKALITIENQHEGDIPGLYYQITYTLLPDLPEETGYFHAQWRRSMTRRDHPEHTILDGVSGRGHYVGTFLAWTQLSNGWWGEGEIKFYLDGDTDYPTICGTGTEDYVGGAWGFGGKTYSTPFLGYPLRRAEPGEVPKHALYRFHILDPIRFKQSIKATIQALGWWPGYKFQPLTDDIASTAYWYQTEPHTKFPEIPPLHQRWPR